MNIRLLRSSLCIVGLCLLTAMASTSQTRRAASARPRVHPQRLTPGLAPEIRASIAGTQAVNLPWVDSLESGAANWTHTGFWHVVTQPQKIEVLSPAINPTLVLLPDSGFLPQAYSGNNAFWYGEDVTGTYIGSDYTTVSQSPLGGGTSASANTGNAITPLINLVGQKNVLLSFWTWWEIEGVNTNDFDLMHVEVSTDTGASWNDLGRGVINPVNNPNGDYWKAYSSGGLGQKGKWIQAYFDLTPYAGKVVLLRFRFDTVDDLYNGFRGWLIDNISVTATTAGTPTIGSVSPGTVNPNQLVEVTGTNFVSGATLTVDTTVMSGAAVSSTTLLQFYAYSLSNGTHSIRITNPDGKSVVKLNAFNVSTNSPPSFYSISPDSAPVGASAAITITGANFVVGTVTAGTTVDIGGLPATNVQVVGTMQINALSPNKLPAGVYNVTVLNPDGLSDVSVLGFRVFSPSVSVAATGDSLIGNAQPLTITPPAGKTFTGGKIFFRTGGSSLYDSLALTGSGPFAVNLPAKAVTIRGVEYYIVLQSANGPASYPAINPDLSPAVLPVRLAKLATPLTLAAEHYKMFSAPMVLDAPGILNQLGDDYGAYNPASWRVFHWETGAYNEAVVSAAAAGPMTMVPGKAFWLVTATGTPFTFKRGTSVQSVQPYTVPLDTGWNQIADPFAFNVTWSTVGGALYLDGPYYYDGTQYRIITTVLKPYEGYFVYNPPFSEFSSLTFYPVESALPPLYRDRSESIALGPGEFVMQIAASVPGTDLMDTYNYVGLRTGASAGRDHMDAPKPPPIGNAVQVDILDGGSAYMQNFKPPSGEGQSWVFDVRTLGMKASATVTLTTSGTLPAGFSVHVIDLNAENAVPVTSGSFQVTLASADAPHYYKVIMGTDAYAAKESNGIPLHPVAYALGQNYPNPFNPSTTIRYALAEKTGVTLEIYTVLGQRVRTLFSGEQTTGEYEVVWDGTNDGGAHVASGVYFYRLRTGDFNAVRKLVMIR